MQKQLVSLLFLFLSVTAFAQPVIEYWDSAAGIKKSEINYLNGMQNGSFKLYYKTGKLEQTGFFKKGDQDSIWKTYHQNGKLESIRQYQRG